MPGAGWAPVLVELIFWALAAAGGGRGLDPAFSPHPPITFQPPRLKCEENYIKIEIFKLKY